MKVKLTTTNTCFFLYIDYNFICLMRHMEVQLFQMDKKEIIDIRISPTSCCRLFYNNDNFRAVRHIDISPV